MVAQAQSVISDSCIMLHHRVIFILVMQLHFGGWARCTWVVTSPVYMTAI